MQSDLVIGSNGACGKGANPRERLLPREGKKDPKRVKEAIEGAEEEDEETMEKGGVIYTYMRREGGVRVRASNRKPTTAGENASRYYSRTSKAFSFHSWELYLPLPTVRRTLLPPSLPVSHPRNAASTLAGFLATREIFLCVSRNASELFEAAEKKPRLDVDVFHVVVVVQARERKEVASTRASRHSHPSSAPSPLDRRVDS